ncbi:hypothetical protein CPC08DRAFT_712329 [Agrocybe pediades]|nr:hypothetical protein CPC08DRAFT_712329 [Agrocybe pediades]
MVNRLPEAVLDYLEPPMRSLPVFCTQAFIVVVVGVVGAARPCRVFSQCRPRC